VLALSSIFSQAALSSDQDKLRLLEEAMNSPASAVMEKPKPRTRAIVFDNDPQDSKPVAEVVATSSNCATVSPSAKSVAVDFPIQFSAGSAEISPASRETLNQISKILALSPNRCVVVEGHTDVSGNYDRNVALSRDRANSVVEYITNKQGMDRQRFIPVGKGPDEPMPNLSPADHKNRRVVFKVIAG
jgi:outer membrane protein OmpA-like peptidoglycan-associated protein